MGGRGGSSGSGGNSGNSRDEKTAKALNPNATPEQVRQFTKSMQAIREKQAAQTAAITQEAQKAVGVIVEDSTRDISYMTGFSTVEKIGANKYKGYSKGHIATITTSPTQTKGNVKIIDVQVKRG